MPAGQPFFTASKSTSYYCLQVNLLFLPASQLHYCQQVSPFLLFFACQLFILPAGQPLIIVQVSL
jgi:hypothetical protein